MATRVLLALELLQHELSCSDEQICSRLRTDLAVRYVCGILEIQVDGSQEHFVLPEVLAQFRSRIDTTLMDDLLTLQAAAAMEAGLVSPAHLVVDTFPICKGKSNCPPPVWPQTRDDCRTGLGLHLCSASAGGEPQ
jgi:hypothetical protein